MNEPTYRTRRRFEPLCVGDVFGRLTVVGELPKQKRLRLWNCKCECGAEAAVQQGNLRMGITRSCGCLRRELLRATQHGESRPGAKTPEYNIWNGMRQRCENTKCKDYPDYGGRGISVCDKWQKSYEAFLADVGRRPARSYSLNRINNSGNYEPGNVEWADQLTQRRNCRANRNVTIDGKTQCLSAWFERLGPRASEKARNYRAFSKGVAMGLSDEQALLAVLGAAR